MLWQTPQENLLFSLNNHTFFPYNQPACLQRQTTKNSNIYRLYKLWQLDRIRQTMTENVNDSTVQQSDQTGTSKDMARSYGKYEKLKDTPDNLYGMFACILQSDFRL